MTYRAFSYEGRCYQEKYDNKNLYNIYAYSTDLNIFKQLQEDPKTLRYIEDVENVGIDDWFDDEDITMHCITFILNEDNFHNFYDCIINIYNFKYI